MSSPTLPEGGGTPAPTPEHLKTDALGARGIAFLVVAAAAPLTVMAGVAPLAILVGEVSAHRWPTWAPVRCCCCSRSASWR